MMKFDHWKIISKYPKDPIGVIVDQRQNKAGFVLNPKYSQLSDPDTINDLAKASALLKKTISKKEKIGIFMDYDADGICAGAILYKTLDSLKAKLEYYVPQRNEGYGLSKGAINYFISKNVKVIVTVDCGIKNYNEIRFANDNGVKIIITDHHLMDRKLPEATAIVHPAINRKKNKNDYSGAGVAFQLARSLTNDSQQVKWLLDLAAISTVADIMPLIGDNRLIVKYGLIVINKTRNLGLQQLIIGAGLNKKIGTYEIGYIIAPRLNAAGRIAKPVDSFKLLITKDKTEAVCLADKLNRYNLIRQKQLTDSLEHAISIVEKKKLYKKKIIVIKGDWNEGIVGLISGKITAIYNRPSIILTPVDGKLKGSARSIPKIDITKEIGKSKSLLLSFGGHKQASGLSLPMSNLKKFITSLEKNMSRIGDNVYRKELIVDVMLKMDELNLSLAKAIEKLAPFGMGNPYPVIALDNVSLEKMKIVGKDNNHMSLTVCDNNIRCKAILFDYDEKIFELIEGAKYKLAFKIMVDSWGGREQVNLNIIDVKKN